MIISPERIDPFAEGLLYECIFYLLLNLIDLHFILDLLESDFFLHF